MKLGEGSSPPPDPLNVTLTLDNVFSFGRNKLNISATIEALQQWLKPNDILYFVCVCEEWATDEVLFYTTLEGLQCSRVFRLDLTSGGARISSVFEEPCLE